MKNKTDIINIFMKKLIKELFYLKNDKSFLNEKIPTSLDLLSLKIFLRIIKYELLSTIDCITIIRPNAEIIISWRLHKSLTLYVIMNHNSYSFNYINEFNQIIHHKYTNYIELLSSRYFIESIMDYIFRLKKIKLICII